MNSIPKMKITRGLLAKSFVVFVLLLLIGCTPQVPFQEYSATSAPEAVDELMRRRAEFSNFEGEGVFELVTPVKKLKLNGNIFYEGADTWGLKFNGPLGIELGEISTNGEEYVINSKLIGGIKTGSMSMPIEVPTFNIVFPELRTMAKTLMPMLDISKSENWELQTSGSNPEEEISLTRTVGTEDHELRLRIDYSPLRVIQETRLVDGEILYHRDYSYNPKKSIKISEITIHVGKIQLNVMYDTLTYNVFSQLDIDFGTFQ